MKLILFDADGTIVDSQAIIHEAMRLCFHRFEKDEPHISQTRSVIGLTLDRAIATVLQKDIDAEVDAMAGEYREIYLSLLNRPELESAPFAGMTDIVRTLAGRSDVLLGLVTGKSRRGVRRMIEANGFGGCFMTIRCADDCPSKPDPAMVSECIDEAGVTPADTLVVGDTTFDMQMARAAGATGVGVNWGYHNGEQLIGAGAAFLARDTADLRNYVDTWLSTSTMRDRYDRPSVPRRDSSYA